MMISEHKQIPISGILSGAKIVKGLLFYRFLCLTGWVSMLMIGLGETFFFSHLHFWIWDRLAVGAFAFILFLIGLRSNLDLERYTKWVYVLFVLFTFQCVLACSLNGFSLGYFMILFIAIQNISISFRRLFHAYLYLALFFFVEIGAVILATDLTFTEQIAYFTIIVFAFISYFLLAKTKHRSISDLKMNKEVLRALVHKTEDSIFITDTMGFIYDFNQRAIDMFGYSFEEFINQDFKILRKFSLSDEEVMKGIRDLQRNDFWTMETVLKKKDGSEFDAYISIGLITHGTRRMLVYRVRDISETKSAERALTVAKEKAEDAAKAKSQFLAVMSHEIRTPLNGVLGMASLLQSSSLSLQQKEFVDTIQKSGQSLMVLINDILDFSKIESGKMKLELIETDLKDSIHEVVDLLRPHAEMKGLRITMDLAKEVPDILFTDVSRFKQIMLNLIGNAIKFTSSGNVHIVCKCLAFDKKNATIEVAVRDTGTGIPQDKMGLLFQSFSQVDSSTSRRFGGTGLGLAICKQIVEMMGGHIEVTSKENVGSEFSFTMMCRLFESKVHGSELSETEVREELDVESISQLKVLIAEDNLINQEVLKHMLRRYNLEAETCINGKEVLEAIQKAQYDIIYMDVQMPEMDGIEAANRITSSEGIIPYIIAMTANASDADKMACMDAGMNAFLSKPFVLPQIERSLWEYLQKKEISSIKAA